MGENIKFGAASLIFGNHAYVIDGIKDITLEREEDYMGLVNAGQAYEITFHANGVKMQCISKIKPIQMFKFTGMWQWAKETCGNPKIVHLMEYGKNERVRIKNYNRALRIAIAKEPLMQ